MTRLYLDTNAFISAYESNTPRGDAMLDVLDALGCGEFSGVTSQLTLAELLPKPLSLGQDALVALYTKILSSENGLSVVPVGWRVLMRAARLRADHAGLRLPDAIHLATALDEHCPVMLSDDRRLPSLPSVAMLRPGPDTLSRLRRYPQ